MLVVKRQTPESIGFLAAFSGNLAGSNNHPYFVPPVYDLLAPDGYFKREEKLISDINRKINDMESSYHAKSIKTCLERALRERDETLATWKLRLKQAKAARDEKRKGDVEVKNKAQTYVDQINSVLTEKGEQIPAEQKEQLTKIRDEAQGAIESDNIEKLREIVGRLEDMAAQAASMGAPGAAAQDAPKTEDGNQTADDVVDADFTDKK